MQGYYDGYRSRGQAEGAGLVYFGKDEPKGDLLGACNYMELQR